MKLAQKKGPMFEQNSKSIIHGILFFIIVTSIVGCGNSAEYTPSFKTVSLSLAWDVPTTYSDGTSLNPANDIKEYRIYYRTESGSYSADSYYLISTPTAITSFTVKLPVSARSVYLVVTAIDRAGMESDFSNEVSRSID